ncbi:MAG: hypothetical protein AAF926_07235, partial [Pseudomonadota bacterium]
MGPTTYNWLFGNGNTLTFPAGGYPVLGPDHQFNVPEGSACISDMQGGLLFYTDGRRLWDRNHALVTIPAHGLGFTGLGGGPGS